MVGAVSWYFGERAGFHAFGRYMLQFARSNLARPKLLHDKNAREQVEPFLTGTTFYNIFNLMYEVEGQLKLLLGLIFNALVLGVEIDAGLPAAYGAVFVILMAMQWTIRRRVAHVYLENQRQNNRLISHGYTAWDNVFSGNRYNRRLWIGGFKSRLRDCLWAQIRAIMTREGLSALGGIIGLAVVFATMTWVAVRAAGDTELLIALAATLPRQIEMTTHVHELASGWNDVLAFWTRVGGIVANMRPNADPHFDERIKFDRLLLRAGRPRQCVRIGRRGARHGDGQADRPRQGARRQRLRQIDPARRAQAGDQEPAPITGRPPTVCPSSSRPRPGSTNRRISTSTRTSWRRERRLRKLPGFSSGERQMRSLQEIVANTDAAIYLLDEWDANLDPTNRATADALVEALSHRARVVEISHRDRT